MGQSSVIVGALLAGFVLYLAAKGRLSTYTGILWGNTAAAPPAGGASGSSGSSGSSGGSNPLSAVASAADDAAFLATVF